MKLGGELRAGYDSNVFNLDDEDDSGVIAVEAWTSAEDELEQGSYRVEYNPTFFYNEDSDADNFWNHRANFTGSYRPSPRTTVTLSDSFARLEKLTFIANQATVDPNIDDENRRTTVNTVDLFASHMLTQRFSVYGAGQHTIYRFDRSQDEDNDYLQGTAGVNYALTPTLSVGGGGRYGYRSFDAQTNRALPGFPPNLRPCNGTDGPGARTRSASGFVSARYQYDENTSAELQAGPARVETRNYVCPGFNTSYTPQDVNQTTWFASGELLRKWKQVQASVRYNRFEGLGGVGNTTINDTLTARVRWQPARHWDVIVRGGWLRRVQNAARNPTTGVRVNTETTTWTLAGTIRRQLARRLSVSLDATYRNQDQDEKVSNPQGSPLVPGRFRGSFEAWRVFAGIRYELEPFRY